MKKIISLLFVSMLVLGGCGKDKTLKIPPKINPEGVGAKDSSVTADNLDKYLYAKDAIFYDLRLKERITQDGYIRNFIFLPFYELIAIQQNDLTMEPENPTLYIYHDVKDADDKVIISAGQKGSYLPRYEESEKKIKQLFPENKKLLFISQSGFESGLIISLLSQIGYNSANLYNLGGFNDPSHKYSYIDAKSHEYLVLNTLGIKFEINYLLDVSRFTKIEYN